MSDTVKNSADLLTDSPINFSGKITAQTFRNLIVSSANLLDDTVTFNGAITAASFVGDGSALSGIVSGSEDPSQLTGGTSNVTIQCHTGNTNTISDGQGNNNITMTNGVTNIGGTEATLNLGNSNNNVTIQGSTTTINDSNGSSAIVVNPGQTTITNGLYYGDGTNIQSLNPSNISSPGTGNVTISALNDGTNAGVLTLGAGIGPNGSMQILNTNGDTSVVIDDQSAFFGFGGSSITFNGTKAAVMGQLHTDQLESVTQTFATKVKQLPIYDLGTGTLIGYVPIYFNA